ncbi:TPA: hypothetical protein ACXJQL_001642 [Stenotrophomonas maltophilia]
MPLVLAGDTTQPDPPVLVIESSSLTLDGICAIYGAGDLKSSFTSVIDSVKQILLAVDKDSKLIDSVRGAQLWK